MIHIFFGERLPGAVVHFGQSPLARPGVDHARGRGDVHGQYVNALRFRQFQKPRPRLPAEGANGARLHAQRGQHAGDVDALAAGLPFLARWGQAEVLDPQRAVEAGVERQRTNFHITIIAHAAPSRA